MSYGIIATLTHSVPVPANTGGSSEPAVDQALAAVRPRASAKHFHHRPRMEPD